MQAQHDVLARVAESGRQAVYNVEELTDRFCL